jgi:NAD(P)H-nitrite reductase
MIERVVIVGAGQAAAQAVDTLRRRGFGGSIALVGEEPYPPYQRPPLSKKYLAGELDAARLLIRPSAFYTEQRVETHFGRRAEAIERQAQRIRLDDGTSLAYDALLLATGARPRPLAVPGAELSGVHVLRKLADADGLRAGLGTARRIVIVGGGYIGLEVAATCRGLGLEVTVLETAPRVMSRVTCDEVSAFFAAEHERHGVRIFCGTRVSAIAADPVSRRVRAVVCADGSEHPADLVLVGVGVVPADELAADAGLRCEDGIVVDEHCRTTDPAIFAAGDCTNQPSPRYGGRVRLESVDNAFEQGTTAALNMLGITTPHDKVPWFWSDQYSLKLVIVGLCRDHDATVLRGDPSSRSFSVCYLRAGELVAVDTVNNPKDQMAARRLVAARVRPDPSRLARARSACRSGPMLAVANATELADTTVPTPYSVKPAHRASRNVTSRTRPTLAHRLHRQPGARNERSTITVRAIREGISMPIRFHAALVLAGLIAAADAHSASRHLTVLHHESIALSRERTGARKERVSFEAYGRRFDLLLESNERVRRAWPNARNGVEPLRGTVEGMPGSWVRLTRDAAGRWRGMVSDGSDVYAIEAASDIASSAVQPIDADSSAPVVFRLSDAILPLDVGSCAVAHVDAPEEEISAQAAYEALTGELQIAAAQAAPTRRLTVGVVADTEFAAVFDRGMGSAEQAIIARMNIVDGIFSEQLGVEIVLAAPTVFRGTHDPFTKSDPKALLEEVRKFRRNSPEHLALGLTHLMTGRNMDGETVGIAYLGSVCKSDVAASLSEGTRSTTSAALIAAHEIGHNFNAPHDGEPGACESTPRTYLMAPRLNGSDVFSDCSIAQMRPVIAGAQCLAHVIPPDVRVQPSVSAVQANVNETFGLTFTVYATGDHASTSVVAQVEVPAGLHVEEASASGSVCAIGAGAVDCTLGELGAGDARTVTLRLNGREPGTSSLLIAVSSANDSVANNNSAQVSVTVVDPAANPVAPAQSSGQPGPTASSGGGGRISAVLLMALACLLLFTVGLRRRTRPITVRVESRDAAATRKAQRTPEHPWAS